MENLGNPAADEFAPQSTYLNTSTAGLLPRRALEAVKALADENAAGVRGGPGSFEKVDAARASFARLVGVDAGRVATGGSVAVHVALIASSLPPGAEVLITEGEFSSVITPFTVRGDLKVRYAPLEELAEAVRPGTALVATSAAQSADGRLADLAAVRAAAAAHGARTLVDACQSAGWLPMDAGLYDFTVTAGYKYLMCPRGVSFLTVSEEAQETMAPLHGTWVGAEDRWNSTYGPVEVFAASARRYDEPVSFYAYHAAEQSLALLEEIGIEAVHAHNTALADRYREGLLSLGHRPVPAPGSTSVSVPGLADREPELAAAGVITAARAGNLRVSFHLYNTAADVDRVLEVLAG
ncbi:aminotransferase class V-fold PLP-dependent enzyme [Streptomyces sannanensis]|uniref:Aminotransferase class V-fold PLP-dependent enzyme n=1 Tax=Streptomyces sannanensis TaxID=285536 RepID=A0ABP6S727_9ACTN